MILTHPWTCRVWLKYHFRELLLITQSTARQRDIKDSALLALALAELARLAEPFLAAAERARVLRRREVGVLLQVSARVFFDDSVEVLVRGCDGVEGVDGRGAPVVRERIIVEDLEEDFWGERIESAHCALACG